MTKTKSEGPLLSHDTLSRSRPLKEDELMGNCCKSKIRLRLERKEEWSRHNFEVAIGILVIKETTWSRPNAHVATRKQAHQQF